MMMMMMMMRLIPLWFRTSAASEIKVQLKEHKMVFTDPDQWISSLLFWMRRFLLEKLLWLRSFSWSNEAVLADHVQSAMRMLKILLQNTFVPMKNDVPARQSALPALPFWRFSDWKRSRLDQLWTGEEPNPDKAFFFFSPVACSELPHLFMFKVFVVLETHLGTLVGSKPLKLWCFDGAELRWRSGKGWRGGTGEKDWWGRKVTSD